MGRNDHEAGGSRSGGRRGPSLADRSRNPNIGEATVLAENNLHVPPDWRLPGGWNIGNDGSTIPPLPRDGDLREVIEYRRSLLTTQQRADPRWADKAF
jgi:hypothetical protein